MRPFEAGAPLFVSVTVTDPTACAGAVTPTDVLPQLLTAAFVPPNDTEGNAGVQTMPVPVSVTALPPLFEPLFGLMPVSTAAPPPAPPPTVASW